MQLGLRFHAYRPMLAIVATACDPAITEYKGKNAYTCLRHPISFLGLSSTAHHPNMQRAQHAGITQESAPRNKGGHCVGISTVTTKVGATTDATSAIRYIAVDDGNVIAAEA